MAYKNKEDRKEYHKQWYIKNKEKILERSKLRRLNNPEYFKQWRKNNSEKIKEYNKQWKLDHPEYTKQWTIDHPEYYKQWYLENLEYYNQRYKNKRKTDLKFNLNCRMGIAIWATLKSNKNGKRWEDLVGYTVEDLKKRLQSTLPPHYTWQDYIKGKLHIDHIIPISVFNFDNSNQIDFKNCWALSNLQLLPAKENLIKHNKLSKPFQPALKM